MLSRPWAQHWTTAGKSFGIVFIKLLSKLILFSKDAVAAACLHVCLICRLLISVSACQLQKSHGCLKRFCHYSLTSIAVILSVSPADPEAAQYQARNALVRSTGVD